MKVSIKNNEILAMSGKWTFSLLIIVVFLITFSTNELILTDEFYYLSLGEQLSIDHISAMLSRKERLEFFQYLFILLLYLFKFMAVSCVLLTAAIFAGLKLTFKDAFKIAIVAEMAFVLASVIKLMWLLLITKEYTLEDLQYFYPLSMITVFQYKDIPQLLVYPLQLLNLFEVLYWLLLAWGLFLALRKDYEQISYMRSLKLVLSAYLPALFLWVCLVSFIIVTITP